MTTGFNFQALPQQGFTTSRQVSDVVNNILKGKTNNVGSVTLTHDAASTTISDTRIGGNSVILLSPMTAHAAAALATTYFSAPGKFSVVINHTNDAQTDKTFSYVVIG